MALFEDISETIVDKRAEEARVRTAIGAARKSKDKDRVNELEAELEQLGAAVDGLKEQQRKLGSPVD